jgi:hypothetical protein
MNAVTDVGAVAARDNFSSVVATIEPSVEAHWGLEAGARTGDTMGRSREGELSGELTTA